VLVDLLPLAILVVLAVGFAVGSIVVASLMGPRSPNPTKLAAYESGNEPLAQIKGVNFAVKFYVVAMLFLIFDVEVVFVFPWAVVMRELAWPGFIAMGIFLGILGVALVYEIRRGGLEWD
jgi:NADH-quinone oxidoreductase subunit A